MTAQVSLLADKPDFIPALAEGTLAQYAHLWPDRGLEWRIARLRTHLNRKTLPIAWVIHDGAKVFGTAALRENDFDGFDHLAPWLSGVFVFPEYRGRGMGATLCATVEGEAIRRGVSKLYLGTFDNHSWYSSMGWSILQSGILRGLPCDVMFKLLVPQEVPS